VIRSSAESVADQREKNHRRWRWPFVHRDRRTVARFAKSLYAASATLRHLQSTYAYKEVPTPRRESRLTPTRTNFLGQYVDLRRPSTFRRPFGRKPASRANALCDNCGWKHHRDADNRIGEEIAASPPFRTVTAAQFCEKRGPNPRPRSAPKTSESLRGWPCGAPHPVKENRSEVATYKDGGMLSRPLFSLFRCETFGSFNSCAQDERADFRESRQGLRKTTIPGQARKRFVMR